MKYIGILFCASLTLFACSGEGASAEGASEEKVNLSDTKTTTGGPEIVFEEESFDFGTAKGKDTIVHQFKFKNTGDQPLHIANVSASCGCTIPNKPDGPIAPGETSVITARIVAPSAKTKKDVRITVDSDAKSGAKVLRIYGQIAE